VTRALVAADGGRPENALTGTLFAVNEFRNDSITVPQADGRMRFWRNTSIASLGSGQVATLPAGVLGYEWDIDFDNDPGRRALMPLSTTTLQVSTYLLDLYSNTFAMRRLRITSLCIVLQVALWCSELARCNGPGDLTVLTR